jgi:hypothetical protein
MSKKVIPSPSTFPFGNCTETFLVEEIFGSVAEFHRIIEEKGSDNFTIDNYRVEYDEMSGIHYFYFIEVRLKG